MPEEKLEILVQLKDFASGALKNIGGNVSRFEASVKGAFKGIAQHVFSLKGALEGLGLALGAREIAQFVSSTAGAADHIGDLSKELGVSVKALSELDLAFKENGLTLDDLERGIVTATKAMAEFRQTGAGDVKLALELLGPSFEAAVRAGRSFEELLPQISEGIKGLSDADRILFATKFFGRGGAPLIRALSEDLTELRKRAHDLGQTLSVEDVRAAEQFGHAFQELKAALEGAGRSIVLPLLPELTKDLTNLADLIAKNRPKIILFFADFLEGASHIPPILAEVTIGLGELFSIFAKLEAAKKGSRGFFLELLGDPEIPFAKAQALGRKLQQEAEQLLLDAEQIGTKRADSIRQIAKDIEASAGVGVEALRRLALVQADIGDFKLPKFPLVLSRDELDRLTGVVEVLGGMVEGSRERVDAFARERDAISGLRDAFRELGDDSQKWGVAAKEAVLSVSHALADDVSDSLFDLVQGTKSVSQAFRAMAKAILQDIARIIIKLFVLKIVEASLGGLGGLFNPSGAQTQDTSALSGGLKFQLNDIDVNRGAVGGIVRRPSLFLLREAGQNEAIVPLMGGDRIPMRGNQVMLPGGRSIKTVPMARGGFVRGGRAAPPLEGTGDVSDRNVVNNITVNFTVNASTTAEEARLIERQGNKIAEIIASKQNRSLAFREAMR